MIKLILFLIFSISCVSFADSSLPYADKILVIKSVRKMFLIKDDKPYREYNIALGKVPIGHKRQEGDKKTPEGLYTIKYRNPESAYHLSLLINYPDKEDRDSAKQRGVKPGSNIFIHGLPNGIDYLSASMVGTDWTDGCIAVTNREIEEIWKLVIDGTPIEILP